jgi:hypothetical protein
LIVFNGYYRKKTLQDRAKKADDIEIVISELTPLFLHSSLICFQFPSTRFQSIDASSESEFCWKHHDAKLFRRRNL